MASILCAGIAVLDEVFRVSAFPLPDTKVQASEFITIGGGNAATHVIFSAQCLRAAARTDDLPLGLTHMAKLTDAFLAVTNGPHPVLWCDRSRATIRETPVFAVKAVDTLGAGDVFHGAFALALVEGRGVEDALRFAAAAAGLKCSRFGGSAVAPRRAEVDALLAQP